MISLEVYLWPRWQGLVRCWWSWRSWEPPGFLFRHFWLPWASQVVSITSNTNINRHLTSYHWKATSHHHRHITDHDFRFWCRPGFPSQRGRCHLGHLNFCIFSVLCFCIFVFCVDLVISSIWKSVFFRSSVFPNKLSAIWYSDANKVLYFSCFVLFPKEDSLNIKPSPNIHGSEKSAQICSVVNSLLAKAISCQLTEILEGKIQAMCTLAAVRRV